MLYEVHELKPIHIRVVRGANQCDVNFFEVFDVFFYDSLAPQDIFGILNESGQFPKPNVLCYHVLECLRSVYLPVLKYIYDSLFLLDYFYFYLLEFSYLWSDFLESDLRHKVNLLSLNFLIQVLESL